MKNIFLHENHFYRIQILSLASMGHYTPAYAKLIVHIFALCDRVISTFVHPDLFYRPNS